MMIPVDEPLTRWIAAPIWSAPWARSQAVPLRSGYPGSQLTRWESESVAVERREVGPVSAARLANGVRGLLGRR